MEPFSLRIALVGNPCVPTVPFDRAFLSRLRGLGFNAVQLNIAWGARPNDEPLNLEDILAPSGEPDERQRRWHAEISRRARLARELGLRTIFHFGAPRTTDRLYACVNNPEAIDIETEQNSVQRPEIVAKYVSLVARLAETIPEVDDILVYTFDQEAWLANEFGNGPTDAGVPLHRRAPAFVRALTEEWGRHRPDGRLWWEPWEISAGSIYAILPDLPTQHFGLMLHSNIAEVQKANPVDRWFRNMALLARDRGIPVCGEVFLSGANEEVEPLQHAFAPGLVWEEVRRLRDLGIAGIKEYFGTRPDLPVDLDLEMAGLCFTHPDLGLDAALASLAARWNAPSLPEAMAAAHRAYALFPWDFSWRWRRLPAQHRAWHTFDIAWVAPGSVAISPSWLSTRRAIFMEVRDENDPHPWLVEDISLRCRAASAEMRRAAEAYRRAAAECGEAVFAAAADDFARFAAVTADEWLHAEESLCALHIRRFAGNVPAHLVQRMADALRADAENETHAFAVAPDAPAPAAEHLAAFLADPVGWCQTHLLPVRP